VAPEEIHDNDSKTAYAIGHESVHIAQAVVSPWLFRHVRTLISIVHVTRQRDRQQQLGPTQIAELKRLMDAEFRSLTEERDGFTVREILEAQAVVQGLRWSAVTADATGWRWAIEKLHPGADEYLKLLRLYADELELGDAVAFEILPAVCALALQSEDPRSTMAALTERARDSPDAAAAAGASMLAFCEWAGVRDPTTLVKSLRERDPEGFQRLPWAMLLTRYFDRFEQIPTAGERLALLLRTEADSAAASIFQPLYAIFEDGGVHSFQGNVADYEIWTRITLLIVDTLEFLDQA
jgi:hypothetical protein